MPYTLSRDIIPLSRIPYQAFGLDKNSRSYEREFFGGGEGSRRLWHVPHPNGSATVAYGNSTRLTALR